MSDTDSGRPRRALEPQDVEAAADDAAEVAEGDDPSRAWVPSGSDEAARGDVSDDEVGDSPEVATPIPPPVPALPEPLQPPEAGRRFSAEPVADDLVATAPRRSAASVSSPPLIGDEAQDIPLGDAGQEPSAAEIDAAVVTTDGAEGNPRRRLWTIIGGAVAAVLALSLIVWFTTQRTGSSAVPPVSSAGGSVASPSASASPVLTDDLLLTSADLAGLRRATTWTQTDVSAGPDSQPACIELASIGGVSPELEANRQFTASQASGTLTQVALALADVQASGTAYTALIGQVAACAGAHILVAYRIDGLADAATSITTALSDGTLHTILIARTGRFVNLADASVKAAVPTSPNALATTLATSLTKQCNAATGTCPTTPKAVGTPPPATETVGWLAWVDLPQLSAGAGTWTATDPAAPDLVGSQCEVANLNKLPGADDALHRTYLLTDDPKAPEGFGVDEAVYVFGKSSEAASVLKTLKNNFKDCGDRTRTATVKDGSVTTVDAKGDPLVGTTYTVTQRISDSKTVTFRVGLAAVGARLVYLLANPSANFDFTQDAWDAVVGRAAQRATQFA